MKERWPNMKKKLKSSLSEFNLFLNYVPAPYWVKFIHLCKPPLWFFSSSNSSPCLNTHSPPTQFCVLCFSLCGNKMHLLFSYSSLLADAETSYRNSAILFPPHTEHCMYHTVSSTQGPFCPPYPSFASVCTDLNIEFHLSLGRPQHSTSSTFSANLP